VFLILTRIELLKEWVNFERYFWANCTPLLIQEAPGFVAALQAFLADTSDPTGLKLYHLRELAHSLSRNALEVSRLLDQLAGKQEEAS